MHSSLRIDAGEAGAEQREAAVRSIMAGLSKEPRVAAAAAQQAQAQDRFHHVEQRIAQVRERVRNNNAALVSARNAFADLVCDGATDLPTSVAAITQLAGLNSELIRSLEGLQQDRLPRCEARSLLTQADFLALLSFALREAASDRFRETLKALAPVLLTEGGLTINPTETLSGELQAQAAKYLETSESLRELAKEIVQKFNIVINESLAQ